MFMIVVAVWMGSLVIGGGGGVSILLYQAVEVSFKIPYQ